MSRLIIISGTPGVGKSSLARALARKLGARAVELSTLVKTGKLSIGFDESRRSLIVDKGGVRKELSRLLRRDGDIVVATHMVQGILPRQTNLQVIVLRLDPVILYRRLVGRRWSRRKIWENVESELLDACYFDAVRAVGVENVSELNEGGMSKLELAEKAYRVIRRGKREPARVDWLSRYDPISLQRKLKWKNDS